MICIDKISQLHLLSDFSNWSALQWVALSQMLRLCTVYFKLCTTLLSTTPYCIRYSPADCERLLKSSDLRHHQIL